MTPTDFSPCPWFSYPEDFDHDKFDAWLGQSDILDRKDFDGGIVADIEDAMRFIERNTRTAYRIEGPRREMAIVTDVSVAIAWCLRDRDGIARADVVFAATSERFTDDTMPAA